MMIKKLTVLFFLSLAFSASQAQSSKATLLTPTDGQTLVAVNPLFSWDTLDVSVDSFTLQVSATNTFDAVVYRESFPDTVYSHTMTMTLEYDSLYYWRVMTYDSLGLKVDSSDIFSFTTIGPPPPAPNNLSPMSASIDVDLYPTLTWSSVPVAANYRVQVATLDNFSDIVVDTIVAAGTTSVNINIRLNSYTVYYWRVAAENTGGLSAWSNFWNFTTLVSSVRDVEGNFSLNAYPNPSTDKVLVSFETSVAGEGQLSLVDLNGKEVRMIARGMLEAGNHEYTIDRTGLSSGVYFVKLVHDGYAQTLKLVIR